MSEFFKPLKFEKPVEKKEEERVKVLDTKKLKEEAQEFCKEVDDMIHLVSIGKSDLSGPIQFVGSGISNSVDGFRNAPDSKSLQWLLTTCANDINNRFRQEVKNKINEKYPTIRSL